MKIDYLDSINQRANYSSRNISYGATLDAGYVPSDGDLWYKSNEITLPQPFRYSSFIDKWVSSPIVFTFPTTIITASADTLVQYPLLTYGVSEGRSLLTNVRCLMLNLGAAHNSTNYFKVTVKNYMNTGVLTTLYDSPSNSGFNFGNPSGLPANLPRNINHNTLQSISGNAWSIALEYTRVGTPPSNLQVSSTLSVMMGIPN